MHCVPCALGQVSCAAPYRHAYDDEGVVQLVGGVFQRVTCFRSVMMNHLWDSSIQSEPYNETNRNNCIQNRNSSTTSSGPVP